MPSAAGSGGAARSGPLTESQILPAWSEPFSGDRRERLAHLPPFGRMDRAWAWGGADGSGVTVAIIDSGVEPDHPAVGGRLVRSVRVELDGEGEPVVVDDPERIDVVGHGTACAGIIHGLAPGAELLDPGARARQPRHGHRLRGRTRLGDRAGARS
jgi:subtilisin family serine protease